MNNFRNISKEMDSVKPPMSLSALIEMHRWAPSEVKSFRGIVSRHASKRRKTRRFLCMNTYLMDAFIFGTKPAVDDRALVFGKLIKKNHDIALLQEVFEDNVKDIILKAWPKNKQPSVVEDAYSNSLGSSGLVIINQNVNQKDLLRNKRFHEFNNQEGNDALADKGVLFTTIDIGLGTSKLELYNTHLNAEGQLARPLQLLEVASFIKRTHKKNNIAILAGDFNLSPDDTNNIFLVEKPKWENPNVRPGIGNYKDIDLGYKKFIQRKISSGDYPNGMTEYQALVELMDLQGFVDMWSARNGTLGYTLNVHEKSKRDKMCKPATDNKQLCDDGENDIEGGVDNKVKKDISKRIDFMFISKPNDSHTFSTDFTRPRRVRYERRQNAPERKDRIIRNPQGRVIKTIKGIDMLSDHIGLSTTLLFSPAKT